jgi:hypothetical protein
MVIGFVGDPSTMMGGMTKPGGMKIGCDGRGSVGPQYPGGDPPPPPPGGCGRVLSTQFGGVPPQ